MKVNNKNIITLIKAIYAGIFIGIGGTAYLALDNKVIGSFLFSIGLLTICIYNMNLYTGKIGYIIERKKGYITELLITLIGNFIGASLTGLTVRLTRYQNYIDKAKSLVDIKLNDNLLSIFILSIFCGILMYIAVNNYKKETNTLSKYILIFFSVVVFILSGFEHCIANIFYFAVSLSINTKVLLYLLIMIIGNSLGSIIISLYDNKIRSK